MDGSCTTDPIKQISALRASFFRTTNLHSSYQICVGKIFFVNGGLPIMQCQCLLRLHDGDMGTKFYVYPQVQIP